MWTTSNGLQSNILCSTLIVILFLLSTLSVSSSANKQRAKKDPRDFTDEDLARLEREWDENDEDFEEDIEDMPEHLRPQPPLDISKLNLEDPEELMKLTKKGKSLMVFVSVSGKPKRVEADELTQLWQTSLFNNHIEVSRYMVDDDRAIFMFKDGSQAWEAKNYIVQQERCLEVSIEGKSYKGKGGKEEL